MPPRGVTIEVLDPDRLDELVEVQNDIFSDYIIPLKSTRQFFLDFQRSVGGSLSNVLVAMKDGEIIGYANPVIDGREAWIGGLGVARRFRGQGFGTHLMEAAEGFCRDRGVETVLLEVIEGNDRARRLYERLGYSATRKYVSAEGRPARFEWYGEMPKPAALQQIIPLHEEAYRDTCWQRRKLDALVSAAKGADCYVVEGGFVVIRCVDTNGFIPFLGVVPSMRRMGIGTGLARFALTRLWDKGAFKVALYNVNDDAQTLRMLDKLDFKVTMKQIEMRKRLTG
jgi:ribosomal protein S18 acetylase RimI-like enzyme